MSSDSASDPTVSVIVRTHNRAHLVGRAIRSVLSQSFRDLEVLVVDDGSTDNTMDVVSSFDDSRVRYLKHETNRGAPAAGNTGILAARGEYVAIYDSDDEILSEALALQMEVFRNNPHNLENLGAVALGIIRIDSRTGQVTKCAIPRVRGYIRPLFFDKNIVLPIYWLAKKEALLDTGIYDEDLPASNRWDLGVRLAAKYQFDVVEQPLYIGYRHEGTHQGQGNLLTRLAAYRYLFEKYQVDLSNYPSYYSSMRRNLSSVHLRLGQPGEARREAWLSIRLNPFQSRGYLYLVLSLFGKRSHPLLTNTRKVLQSAFGIGNRSLKKI